MLKGYKVLEVATHIAGPSVGMMMADWGADVVKVESANGDPIRWIRPPAEPGGAPPNFELDNRGKRGIVLDYRKPEGLAVLLDLVRRADVFITTVRPSALARAGLDYPALREINPGLVYASLSGYGLQGAAADMPAFDITAFWARSGLGALMSPPEGPPIGGRPGMGDHIAGLTLAIGVFAALLAREKTGEGRLVEASLLRAGQYAISYDIAEYLRRGEILPRAASRAAAAWTAHYRSADERWFCVYAHDPEKDYASIYAAAGKPDLANDPRYATPEARALNGQALVATLDEGFATRTLAEIGAVLDERGVIWAPFQLIDDLARDPVSVAAGSFVRMDDGKGGVTLMPAGPVRLSGLQEEPLGHVPRIGEHTEEVLAELGYDGETIARLKRLGAVS